jgi:hypothetical protein
MKIYVANYVTSPDVECMLDDKYDTALFVSNMLRPSVFIPVVSRDRDDAFQRIVAMLATEITDLNDDDDPECRIPVPTPEMCVLMTDHEFSTPTTFVYAYDHSDDYFVRIVVTELTID